MYQLGDTTVIRMRPLGEIGGDRTGRTIGRDGLVEGMITIPRDVVQDPLSKKRQGRILD
jgi:hypothetical protein